MRIYEHITSQNVKHKMILSKIYPLSVTIISKIKNLINLLEV